MKLLICGDSFSYDHGYEQSWVTMIKDTAQVTNLSQCGCGEYKIYKQLMSVDLSKFDKIIVSHGSPNRIYINQPHALRQTDTHKHSDLLFTDVEEKKNKDNLARVAYEYFVNIFDVEYYAYVHNLICRDIDELTSAVPTLHITHFDYSLLYDFNHKLVSFHDVWLKNKGNINHYNALGNNIVYNTIQELLKNA